MALCKYVPRLHPKLAATRSMWCMLFWTTMLVLCVCRTQWEQTTISKKLRIHQQQPSWLFMKIKPHSAPIGCSSEEPSDKPAPYSINGCDWPAPRWVFWKRLWPGGGPDEPEQVKHELWIGLILRLVLHWYARDMLSAGVLRCYETDRSSPRTGLDKNNI